MSTPKAKAIWSTIRLQPQVSLRRFISRTASISSFVGPLALADGLVWGKQQSVLSLDQHFMKVQQSRGLQDDGGPQNARRPHHESALTGDDAIGRPKVGRALPTSIQN
jgi:hypothetical protein